MSLTIIDYGAGNLKSLTNMIDTLGYEYLITNQKEDILNAKKLIFPGVGHFGQFMESLNEKGLSDCIKETINKGIPFLGICVGLQVLFQESEEAPGVKGLGIFPGKVIRFSEGKVPQIGWNKLETTPNNTILTEDYVYFVNSYYVVPDNSEIISSYSTYHNKFAASVQHKNVSAFQFHPERSGQVGKNILKNWLELNK